MSGKQYNSEVLNKTLRWGKIINSVDFVLNYSVQHIVNKFLGTSEKYQPRSLSYLVTWFWNYLSTDLRQMDLSHSRFRQSLYSVSGIKVHS